MGSHPFSSLLVANIQTSTDLVAIFQDRPHGCTLPLLTPPSQRFGGLFTLSRPAFCTVAIGRREACPEACQQKKYPEPYLGGGFKYFLFSPLLGEDSHFD